MKHLLFFIFLFSVNQIFAQVELVDADNDVYDYLERMQIKNIISGYNPAEIPVSIGTITVFLKTIHKKSLELSPQDKSLLNKFLYEFSTSINSDTISSFFNKPRLSKIFDDTRQKYLYTYKDSTLNLFLDGIGGLNMRVSSGDSVRDHKILIGELGFRIRATFSNSIGVYLKATNGHQLTGDSSDFNYALSKDKKIYASGNTFEFHRNYFDNYEGYLRYQTPTEWLSFSLGRYQLVQGTGFIDKLFISPFSVPFDFVKLNLKSKILSYTFLYGSLRGDSLGVPLSSKNISTHRLDLHFSDRFKVGIYESVIISNQPFSFTFLNPVSFLTSAEFNKASQGTERNINNTFLGIDMMIYPMRNFALQGTFLVDDLEFATLFKNNAKITNKFAYQIGSFWADAFTIPNLDLKIEYTKIDPYVYTHATNKSNYANWDYSIGHQLPPNSDEIAVELGYAVSGRLKINSSFKFQRSADGITLDSSGRLVANYGGNIAIGSGYDLVLPSFLQGNRKNRTIFNFHAELEPIKQYYLTFDYMNKIFDNIFESRKMTDNYFTFGLRVDY